MSNIKSFKMFESNSKMVELANDIMDFVDEYAKINPNYDPEFDEEDGKYTGPDVSMLIYASDLLKRGDKPSGIWSDWGSGCYGRYSDSVGRDLHDSLIKRIKEI